MRAVRYFDFNATTPLLPAARAALIEALEGGWQNPSSPYAAAAGVHARLDAARARLGELLSCPPECLIFNSGATEGNNALFRWLAETAGEGRVAISAIEHPCVREAARHYFPGRVIELPVDGDGRVEVAALEAALASQRLALVSIMAANNETGVLQDWAGLLARCREAGVPFH
ncbi:MAG: aminotransferase class V-fold PLP-dependent enzyme, partial [Planctomycetota bacterium]